MNIVRLQMCVVKALCYLVVIVVKNLRQYLLRVHSQARCRFNELKGVKCESVKMQKQQH